MWLCGVAVLVSVCTLFVSTSIDVYLSNQRFYGSIAFFIVCELEIVASNYFCFILEGDEYFPGNELNAFVNKKEKKCAPIGLA